MTPTIIDHPSPNHSSRNGTRVDTIVIHHTGPGSDHLGWLCNPASEASAHYLIRRDGVVFRLVDESRKAWHAGRSCLPWERERPIAEVGTSVNPRSIGIELENDGNGEPFPEPQMAALCWLVRDIVHRRMIRWDRPDVHATSSGMSFILGHRDVAPGRKTDPADNFDWGRIRQALAEGAS